MTVKRWWERTPQGRVLWDNRRRILVLARSYGVSEILVFGSVARGDANDDSDIDLYVTIDVRRHHPDQLVRLAEQVEIITGFPVDIGCELTTDARIRHAVGRDSRKLG